MSRGKAFLLKNGRLIDPAAGIDKCGDLVIANGKISAPGAARKIKSDIETIDLSGKWVMPGWIDMHVHLRQPGQEYKETIASGTAAAAAGGFTAVVCMPNTVPVNDNQSVTRFILEQAHNQAARVYPVAAISHALKGEVLAEFGELQEAGAVAVSDDGMPVSSSLLMRRALEYSSNFGIPVISHAEELSLSQNGAMNEGEVATRLGLKGIPRCAEEIMVYRDISLAAMLNIPVHIAHISTRESVNLIRRAKEQGIPVTAETAPHYFSLTEEAVSGYNTSAKMNPPLRTLADIEAIKEGLADGTIDAIATDHAPHSTLEKDIEFDQAANGIIGLQTAAPLSLALVREKRIDAGQLVALLSLNPARILHLSPPTLAAGAVADITVVDPDHRYIFTEDRILSKSKNSPFIGWEMTGKAVLTIVGGRITYKDI